MFFYRFDALISNIKFEKKNYYDIFSSEKTLYKIITTTIPNNIKIYIYFGE